MKLCLRLSFAVLVLILCRPLFAGTTDESAPKVKQSPEELNRTMQWWAERPLNAIQNFQKNADPNSGPCETCGITGQGDYQPRTCEKNYLNVYKKKTTASGGPWGGYEDGTAYIDMHIVFGYADFGDEVDDKYTREAFVNEIRRPCRFVPGVAACGFYKDPDDADLLYKDIDGPTGPVTIRINVKNSSATDSEARNRVLAPNGKVATLSDEQALKTQAAEDSWFGGLAGDAAVVIYSGHFRGGGGPSMGPPNVSMKTRSTDYDGYRKNPESMNKALQILRNNKTNPPAIVGLFACYSEPLAGKVLQAAAPKTAFALTGDSSQEANLAHTFSLIDDVLGMRCQDEVMESFNALTKLPYDHLGLTYLHGLFP